MKSVALPLMYIALLMLISLGCKDFWEAKPKEIYSPINLNKEYSVNIDYSQYEKQDIATVSFTVDKDVFNIVQGVDVVGVLVFYDTLSISLHLKDALITDSKATELGNFYIAKESNSNESSSLFTVDVPVELIKGGFIFFLPVIKLQNNKTVYARGYLKSQISPWVNFSNLSTSSFNNFLFTIDDNLLNMYYNTDSIFLSKFDQNLSKFVQFQNFKLSTNISQFSNQNIPIYISSISYIYFDPKKNQYHIFVNTSPRSSINALFPFAGELILSSDYKVINFEPIISYYSVTYNRVQVKGDSVYLVYNRPIFADNRRNPSNPQSLDHLRVRVRSKETNSNFFQFDLDQNESVYEPYLFESSSLFKPTLISFINGYLFLKYPYNPYIKLIRLDKVSGNLSKNSLEDLWIGPILYDNSGPYGVSTSFTIIEEGGNAYITNNNLNMFKISIDSQGKPVVEDLKLNWLPANYPKAFSQGLVFQNKLLYLVNGYQLWTLDPKNASFQYGSVSTTVIPKVF